MTVAQAAPMVICAAPLEPEAEAEALAAVEPDVVLSVVDDESVVLDEVVSVVLEPTVPAEPVVLVAPTVESTAPEAAVVASAPEVAVVAAAPDVAVASAAEVAVAAADPVVEAAVEVAAWPFTAAKARAAITRTWNTFMALEWGVWSW
ncbi:hypothetical protein L915_02759 [Phytophthora nicotianae]|uniref:Uncharacterized protein n=1 Tax=Phytophthora nicotianae TaxID=4792 RepID=W2HG73_PHYNI|nr:hypothetical protein L915_02759 [Phytophthora nicotianae]